MNSCNNTLIRHEKRLSYIIIEESFIFYIIIGSWI